MIASARHKRRGSVGSTGAASSINLPHFLNTYHGPLTLHIHLAEPEPYDASYEPRHALQQRGECARPAPVNRRRRPVRAATPGRVNTKSAASFCSKPYAVMPTHLLLCPTIAEPVPVPVPFDASREPLHAHQRGEQEPAVRQHSDRGGSETPSCCWLCLNPLLLYPIAPPLQGACPLMPAVSRAFSTNNEVRAAGRTNTQSAELV